MCGRHSALLGDETLLVWSEEGHQISVVVLAYPGEKRGPVLVDMAGVLAMKSRLVLLGDLVISNEIQYWPNPSPSAPSLALPVGSRRRLP
jgi:hypothetical protein